MGNEFIFFNDKVNIYEKTSFVGLLNEMNTISDVMHEYYKVMHFPDYFGFNWDALNDCLLDLSWIKQKNIILVHKHKIMLSEKDCFIYLRILYHVCFTWQQPNSTHTLCIFFRVEDRIIINKILEKIKAKYNRYLQFDEKKT